jgi:hypothetical protein
LHSIRELHSLWSTVVVPAEAKGGTLKVVMVAGKMAAEQKVGWSQWE